MPSTANIDTRVEIADDLAAVEKHGSDGGPENATAIDPKLQSSLLRKQDARIIPLAAGIYLLCYLDRSNIGNAKVLNSSTKHDLLSETGMSNLDYTIALMVFLIAYALFEVPSNYFLKRMKPSRWISFLMFSWGTITMCLGAAHNYGSVTAMRFLLGVFEAGNKSMTWEDAKSTLLEWRLWCHYLIYFGISAPFSSLSLFTPSITAGLGFADLRAQLMTVPPYAAAYVVTLLVSWSADRYNARALHSAAFSLIGAVGFIASAVLPAHSYSPRYGCLIVAACGSFACIPPLLGWLSSNLQSTAAIGLAIALNISMGAPGQIVGVWIYKAEEAKKGYPTGHWTNAGLLLFVSAGCIVMHFYYVWRNRRGGVGDPIFKY
ncbi:hypothetical protein NW757_008842 [Fusarium falciforme]|nr:hypothetical protein NW757_008842 [Fusarium falciforme]